MSAATAMYCLGDDEVFQCHRCGTLYHGGDEMEITADPEGIARILCCDCSEIEERDRNE